MQAPTVMQSGKLLCLPLVLKLQEEIDVKNEQVVEPSQPFMSLTPSIKDKGKAIATTVVPSDGMLKKSGTSDDGFGVPVGKIASKKKMSRLPLKKKIVVSSDDDDIEDGISRDAKHVYKRLKKLTDAAQPSKTECQGDCSNSDDVETFNEVRGLEL